MTSMMTGEIELKITASKAWDIFTSNEKLSKVDPHLLSSAEYLQGDGSPGSIRLFKLGPGLHGYVNESMQKIEKVVPGQCISYRVIGGQLHEMYDPYHATFSFVPIKGSETERCMAEWKTEFMQKFPEISPPEKAKDVALQFLKSFEKFEC